MDKYANKEKNSKLKEWLIILSNKDWREVATAVDSGVVYNSPVSRTALGNIIQHHKKLKQLVSSTRRGTELNFENFKKITKQKMNSKDWGNISSEIPKACFLWKKIQIIRDKHIPTDLEMQAFFLENRMRKNLTSINNVNEKNIRNSKIDNLLQGSDLVQIILLQLNDVSKSDNRKEMIKGKKTVTLDDYQDAIELFYHGNKLRVLCQKRNRSSWKSNLNLTKDEMIWDELIPEKYLAYPQIKVYAKIYYMMRNKCEKTFFEIKHLLLEDEIFDKLSVNYLADIYRLLITYTIARINEGKQKYLDFYLDFIQILADNNLLSQQGRIPIWSFKNIINGAIKLKRFEWAENFILNQKNKLEKTERKAIVEYCSALINYRRGHFEEAYNLLHYKPLSKDPLIRINTSILLLHIYLDHDPNDLFLSKLTNLRGMVNAKTGLSDKVVKKWKITLNRISKVQHAFNKTMLMEIKAEIIQDIEEGRFYTGRDWMLDFVERNT